MRKSDWPLLAGLAAPLLYAATVLVAAWFTPGYSHLHHPVSALFAAGAPLARPVALAFAVYNILLAAFAIGLAAAWRGEHPALRLAAASILANALLGLVIELFPMDALGAPVSLPGTIHMVIAGLLVLTCATAMIAAAIGWWHAHARATRITALATVVMLATGALAAMAAAQSWPLLGLLQRLTIGSYLAWIFYVAVLALRRGREILSAWSRR